MAIVYEDLPGGEGGRFMDGAHLVARLGSRTQVHVTHQTASGPLAVVAWEEMPRGHWRLHFVAADVSLAVVEAVVAAMPKPGAKPKS